MSYCHRYAAISVCFGDFQNKSLVRAGSDEECSVRRLSLIQHSCSVSVRVVEFERDFLCGGVASHKICDEILPKLGGKPILRFRPRSVRCSG